MQLYNTLTRREETFEPAGDEVKLYVCGLTTSDFSHIGHAMSSIAFEVLDRFLTYRGYRVRRIQNFTDVDDKVIARAQVDGTSSEEVAERFIQAFHEDMDALNLKRATLYPRATEEIPQIIHLIAGLVDKGFAYEAQGSVYFRVKSDPGYGKLSNRSVDEMLQGSRFDLEPGKEAPADFAMWKASKPDEPAWDSPWGPGRPGWHIECSAMALRHLGETIDIHGGGLDLIFPHHENEVAQSEAYTGQEPFARFWAHNGLLQMSGDKMSKSIGNTMRVRDILARHGPDAVRLWILSSHYRSPLTYDESGIAGQEQAVRRLRRAVSGGGERGSGEPLDASAYRGRFEEAMADDLNTPQAIASLFELAREVNRARDAGRDVREAQGTLRSLAGILGLTLEHRRAEDGALPDEEVERLLAKRSELRKNRQFAEADELRAHLEQHGILVADSPQGTTWSRS